MSELIEVCGRELLPGDVLYSQKKGRPIRMVLSVDRTRNAVTWIWLRSFEISELLAWDEEYDIIRSPKQ